MKMKNIIFAISAATLFVACGRDTSKRSEIVRLDRVVAETSALSASEKQGLIETNEPALGDYLYMMGYSSVDLAGAVDSLARSAAFKVFYPDVESRFVASDSIERVLGRFDDRFSEMFPDAPHYGFYGVVSPYRQPIMMVDSLVFVALNHYLGADYEGYSGMERYAREVKTARHLPYDIAEAAVAVRSPYSVAPDATLLNRMIYEGAIVAAVLRLIPDSSVGECLGWTDAQLALVEANEGEIWKRMAASGLIYSTDPLDEERLFAPSPATAVVSRDLPGRLGRYIGYRIVCAYLENHPDTTVRSMLEPEFYNVPSRLIESGYDPSDS